MDHQWRAPPHPIQGNICPTCSASHFPFCPPHPNPRYPVHMQAQSSVYPNTMVDPSQDPYPWNRNPNLSGSHNYYHTQPPSFTGDPGNANNNRGGFPIQRFDNGANAIGVGGDYSMNDRNSKRLKVDGTHPGLSATEAYLNPSMGVSNENERRLKLIHDHGGSMNGLAPRGQDYNSCFRAGQASISSNGYHLDSSRSQSFDYLHAPYGSHEDSGEKFYPNAVQYQPYDQRNNALMENHSFSGHPPLPYTTGRPDQTKYGYGAASHMSDGRPPMEFRPPTMESYQSPASHQNFSARSHYGVPKNGSYFQPTQEFDVLPPLPASPLPLPLDTPGQWTTQPKHSSAPAGTSSLLFPLGISSSTPAHFSHPPAPESHSLAPPRQHSSQPVRSSDGPFPQDSQGPQTLMFQLGGQGQPFHSKHNVSDKPKIIDASSLFKPPSRDRRPDHFVIILRGLPGSGKSYLAKMLRDLEVEHGGNAPRIHSMDDYFMTEVEKVEESESLKSSARGKKSAVKKVLEYCYEPEMEEAYRSSMLKAFKKTLDEGAFTFIIVDDRNLRVADFAQFWATAKRSGYEVYLLETSYRDPVGCTARNIHGFTRDDIEKMAEQWEEAPSLYLQLDAKSLFHGDDLKESDIQEVDMDMDDEDLDRDSSKLQESQDEKVTAEGSEGIGYDGSSNDEKRWDAEADNPDEEVKDLKCSKWSGDFDEDNAEDSDMVKGKSSALSGLFQAYAKEGKSVHWGDKIANTGFSIGAMKKANMASLIIGPGSGYNLKSNPLPVEEARSSAHISGDKKRQNVFQERLRAERESFKAVFDRRRQRIGGLDAEEE